MADDWYVSKSTHFIVYYKKVSGDFIRELIDKAEDYYNDIADELGFRRFNYWLWDNRAKIYVFNNARDYQEFTGQPNWSSGCAVVESKEIYTYPYAKIFFETILPHEMSHIIFREFVGFNNRAVPLWLDEGVAVFYGKSDRFMIKKNLKEAIKKNYFINLTQLTHLDISLLQTTAQINLFYAEAFSIVDYLIKELGRDKFVSFCQSLRDKQDLEKALNDAFRFKNIQELDKAWQSYINNE